MEKFIFESSCWRLKFEKAYAASTEASSIENSLIETNLKGITQLITAYPTACLLLLKTFYLKGVRNIGTPVFGFAELSIDKP